MAPIRVAIVGLNGTIKPGVIGGQWGVQHIAALKSSPNYEVVAVCNSTVESASRAIAAHELGPTVKAYGSAKDLAADPNVELVSIVVHVDKHLELARPVVQAGKDVFIEYPVASNVAEVEELDRLAKEAGVKVCIGTQSVADPAYKKVKELLRSGAIGDVVMSSFDVQVPFVTSDGWSHDLAWWLSVDSTVNRLIVAVGHTLVLPMDVLGDFESVQSVLKVHGKTAKILDDAGNVIDPAYVVTVPDTFLVQGVQSSGAVSRYSLRCVRSTVDGVGFRWLISGSDGELELIVKEGTMFQRDMAEGKIRVRKWGAEAEEVAIDRTDAEHVSNAPDMSRNVARVYEAFAKGDEGRYLTLEKSTLLHKALHHIKEDAAWAA